MKRRRLVHDAHLLIAVGLTTAVIITSRQWEAWQFDSGFIAAMAAALVLNSAIAFIWARHALVLSAAALLGVVSALPFGLGAGELSALGIGQLLGFDAQIMAAAFVPYLPFFTFLLALAGAVAYGRLTLTGMREPA